MPGVVRCGRCGGSVTADAVAVDVRPPRASARAKRWRRATPQLRGAAVQLGAGAARLHREILGHWQPGNVSDAALVWRMIVPGWPQIHCGRTLRGKVILGIYLVLLAGGLVFAGTTHGALLLGLAISCHVSSILDISLLNVHGLAQRIVRSLVTFVAVVMLVYVPVGWLLGQIVSPQQIMTTVAPFQVGDVLLINPSAYRFSSPNAGDVVLYDIPRTTISGRTNIGYQAQIVVTGAHVDRVLAVAGQIVESRDGVLHVDGEPSPYRPLNPHWRFAQLQRTVPQGQLLIFPSTNPYITPATALELCFVAESGVAGKVLLQTHPLDRFGFID
jgi:type IV secretory pathway protease TraF